MRLDGRGVADPYPVTFGDAEKLPRCLGKPDLVEREQALTLHLKESRLQLLPVVAKQDLRSGG